jgi:hypothetical protein
MLAKVWEQIDTRVLSFAQTRIGGEAFRNLRKVKFEFLGDHLRWQVVCPVQVAEV